jgi:hypothetical protein
MQKESIFQLEPSLFVKTKECLCSYSLRLMHSEVSTAV